MAQIIDMPKLSDTMTVGTLVKWLKNEGDVVKSGSMLAEVETDKATMELESFFDGTLLKIFAPDGSQVELGAPLCAIGKPGEKVDAPAGRPTGQATGEEKPAATANGDDKQPEPSPEDKDKASTSTASKNEVQARPASVAAPAATPSPRSPDGETAPAGSTNGRLKISPLAKKLAAEKG